MAENIAIISILFFSVVMHECAHGLMALWCGDPTAKNAGRLTLNPASHVDLFGTIILPVSLIVLRSLGAPIFPIGWAKPVPVDFTHLRNPRRDMFLVAVSGPMTNICLALAAAGGFHVFQNTFIGVKEILSIIVVVNLILAFFNLTPIPPLDGSRMLSTVLPKSVAYQYAKLERFGIIIVIVLLNFGLFDIIGVLVGMVLRKLGITAFL